MSAPCRLSPAVRRGQDSGFPRSQASRSGTMVLEQEGLDVALLALGCFNRAFRVQCLLKLTCVPTLGSRFSRIADLRVSA